VFGWDSSVETNAFVTDVEKGSPAWKAGIRKGDIILEIDDRKVTGTLDLLNAIGLEVGKTLRVKVERFSSNGQTEILNFQMQSMPAAKQ
jgi:serine protease Do